MINVDHLLAVIDAYKSSADVPQDTTVSTRIFGDSKKVAALRGGAGVTVLRFNDALRWLDANWPDEGDKPDLLRWLLLDPQDRLDPMAEDAA